MAARIINDGSGADGDPSPGDAGGGTGTAKAAPVNIVPRNTKALMGINE